ncbi:tetratricopeptide repeat protein [Streptomyces sp. H10-C2]|uniref:tetratricopeptide repeat protein n=1 Tax=unclassified Streptomyces TaxID=2593676 RepID=UPI0024BBBFAE|nr:MULTISPECIES: tetratricopeptide repeat protein [unclassified Streptomyces]MDJ0340009.1 tetratricopeptide repeat protein [Streptomyces sp. PH10-H1]MDJ0369354.1 tetratricopeptide repeat protein [Streptomyces sp. H10-C2]
MASPSSSPDPAHSATMANTAFRQLRGDRSPSEFAAAVRRSAREIGEQVSCDARYIGRVEAGEIRCPNYAYERVFRHMFPGRALGDLGFAPREAVRGRHGGAPPQETYEFDFEESDVLRRAFMTGGPAVIATALVPGAAYGQPPAGRVGAGEVHAVQEAVRHIRLHDDRHGADGLYQQAGQALRTAYRLLDEGAYTQSVADGLYAGAGELAVSVGWLAHDSGRFTDARSYYAEALATARVAGDPALEAHAFCNTAFLARDAGRPHEAVRAAQAAQSAARRLASPRLLSLLALREAGGRAGLGDRSGCERALARAQTLYGRGPSDADPQWMTFFGEAELAGLEAQSWSALGDHRRAADSARRAVGLQDPHFARNIALYGAELSADLAAGGHPDEAAAAGSRVLDLLGRVQSSRVRALLDTTTTRLRPHHRTPAVAAFLNRHA